MNAFFSCYFYLHSRAIKLCNFKKIQNNEINLVGIMDKQKKTAKKKQHNIINDQGGRMLNYLNVRNGHAREIKSRIKANCKNV